MAVINTFGGVFPRMAWHTLPENAAVIAHDVKLRNGKLEAWRERLPVGMGVVDALTLWSHGCCFLTWDQCVSVADYLVDYDRFFITGNADKPEVFVLDNCIPTYLYLGVPNPTAPPQVRGTESFNRECSDRSYVYTYVNLFGEESAPSPSSNHITVADGTSVTVLGISDPPDGYGITKVNIYRTATAYRVGNEKEQTPLTEYLRVASLDLPLSSYTDSLLEKFLGAALTTREVRVPPEDLRKISYVTGTGVLTGVTNNQVHFSQNFQPHNWPSENDITLPHNIVNMVTVDQYAIVSTDSYPYVVQASPSCEARVCRPVNDVDIPLPDIGCGYPNSAVATPFGMVYSSKDGLVLVSPDAKFQLITATWYSTERWAEVRPDTVRLAYWRGYLVCVTDVVSFMIEIDGKTYNDFTLGAMVTIRDTPVDMHVTASGELLLLQDRVMYQWNAASTRRPYVWESRELTFGGDSAPTTAKVRTNDIMFRLATPVEDLYYERKVTDETPFRLGRIGRHLNYRIRLYGTGTVDYVQLGMATNTIILGQ